MMQDGVSIGAGSIEDKSHCLRSIVASDITGRSTAYGQAL